MPQYKDIFEAIRENDIEAVKTFLPDQLELMDKDGRTPLCLSCIFGHTEIARLLLDNNAYIKAYNDRGWRTLHEACYWGRTEIVRMLIDRGVNIQIGDDRGNTPLHWACMWNRIEIIQLFLDNGADIEARNNDGRTPLYWACYNNRHKTSELLVKRGADPFAIDRKGKSAIDCDTEIAIDKDGNKIPHKEILMQLRAEYINKQIVKASERTAALSSGWEMEM